MFRKQALAIRELFTADQETRRAFGGPPYTNDLEAELKQARALLIHKAIIKRTRMRLGRAIWDSAGWPLAYLGMTIAENARPNSYERAHVMAGTYLTERHNNSRGVTGVFVRRLVVHPARRGTGLGRSLLLYALCLSEERRIPLYCDTKCDNASMRELALSAGGAEHILWHTPNGTPMVRHRWG